MKTDRLCGLMVRVPKVPGSIPGHYKKEKKKELVGNGIHSAS
jgi:hypothetical protein